MSVLVAGDWHSELHEETIYRAFRVLGHEVRRFSWHEYFRVPQGRANVVRWLQTLGSKAQNKYILGPLVARINRDFLRVATEFSPELVFVYRGTHLAARTLRALKARHPRVVVVGYNNDDPFAPGHPYWLWRHYLAAIPVYDIALAYRQHNLADLKSAGAQRVRLLRSWFDPERNYPVELTADEMNEFESDVVFVGHYETDGRLEALEAIVRAGFRLRLFGPGYDWDPVIARSPQLRDLRPVRLVWGEDYNRALCGARIALCFFSRLNRDGYTRRSFEIPATRTMMLSEYGHEAAALFKEGTEVEFFRSGEEMIDKIRTYVADEPRRKKMAEAGYCRVFADGHDVVSRMRQLIQWVSE